MKSRIAWIDVAKGIGMILVMFAHVSLPVELEKYIYSFHVPLFFFLSGYCLSVKKYNNFIGFLSAKCKSLLIPYMIFSIFNYTFYLLFNQYANNVADNPIIPLLGIFIGIRGAGWGIATAALWFIQALFICEIIMYFLIGFTKGNIRNFSIAIFIFSIIGYIYNTFIGIRLIWSIDVALVAIAFIGFGYIAKNSNMIDKIDNYLYLIILMIINITIGLMNTKINMYWGRYGNHFMFYIAAISGLLTVIIISKKIDCSKILEFVGQNTFIYLGIHQYVIFSVLNRVISKVFSNSNDLTLIFIAFFYVIFTLIVLYPVIKFLNRYCPFIIGKKRNNSIILQEIKGNPVT